MRLSVIATLLLCSPVGAAEIDGSLKVPPYQLVRLSAKNLPEKAGAQWIVFPRERVDIAQSPRGVLQFVAPPGQYTVVLLVIELTTDGSIATSEASAMVTIGDLTPPVPPAPNDPLIAELQRLYDSDTDPNKQDSLKLLAELYRQAQTLADDPSITSTGQLAVRLSAAGQILLADRAKALRRRIADELAATFGDDPDAPIDRAKAKQLFAKIHNAILSIKL